MKRVLILALSLVLLAGCGTTVETPEDSATEATTVLTTMEASETDANAEATSAIIWAEGDANRFFDENGVRRIAVSFKEIDLSKMTWNDRFWDDLWPGIEPVSDLTQIFGQRIAAREDAARIAVEVMVNEQAAGNRMFVDAIGLAQVAYDPSKSIWVITYWQDRPGSDLSIAVDGNTGELIRIWAYGE